MTTDVAVVGGGVIGLSVAYALLKEGRKVTLLDRGPIGREASWAGAGIISPGSERPSKLAAAQLRTLSARMQAEWANSLLEETGIDNGYRVSGGVDVALDDRDAADLNSAAGRWRDEGIAFEKLGPDDLDRVEPGLSREIRLAYFLPDRAQIRNPRHLQALEAAIRLQGGVILSETAVEGFDVVADRITGIKTAVGSLACDSAVIAAGAWSGPLLGTLGLDLMTRPVRGQIALLNPGRPTIRRIVEWGKQYLVPRDDGRILVGSTEEDVGFVRETSAEAVSDLYKLACRLIPGLEGAAIERSWAGLRPGSFDTRPYLGMAPGFRNVVIATGHQRAGLQLSTGTAAIVAALVAGRESPIDLKAFRVDRRPSFGENDAFRS